MSKRKPKSNPCRQTLYARRTRDELIEKLGGVCVKCGSAQNLEFDHINGREYDPAKLSSSARLARYKQEAARNELRLLCGDCNNKERVLGERGRFVPTLDRHSVQRTSHMDFAGAEF